MDVENGRERERDKSRTDGRVSGWRPVAFIKSVSRDVDGDNDEKRTAGDEQQLTAIDRTTIDVEIVRRSVVEATGAHPVVHGSARTTYSVCRKRDANCASLGTFIVHYFT